MQRDELFLAEMLESAENIVQLLPHFKDPSPDLLRYHKDSPLEFHSTWRSQLSHPARHAGALPEIPWRNDSNLRNRVVHGYWMIDIDILLKTASQDLMPLIRQIRKAQANLSHDPGRARPDRKGMRGR
jgi:hypothetical protein